VRYLLGRHLGKEKAAGIHLVAGLYNRTLTPALVKQYAMRPAAYVDIDCDLFGSSMAALTWLLKSRLIVPGTLIAYDDWWTVPCVRQHSDPTGLSRGRLPSADGEWRAHMEMARRFGVTLVCVAGPCRYPPRGLSECGLFKSVAPVFLVRSVGGTADAGVRISPREMRLMLSRPLCRAFSRDHRVLIGAVTG
jgi:hypothetical protein